MPATPAYEAEKLDLSSRDLESISSSFFTEYNPAAVKELDLSKNKIKSIPPNTFAEFVNLRVLNLDSNQIETVNAESFNGLVSLEKLYFYDHKLKSMPPNLFVQLKQLEYLCLCSKELEVIDETSFRGLELSLKTLCLHENGLKTAPSAKTFSDLTKLEKLDLNF
jgi:Leucine-rich repeat (LRR) protein